MKQIQSKMVTVESRGFVMTSRGRVMTPIRTPYRENVDRIWFMITQDRADVVEHIGGRKIHLNVLNFDADNSVEKKETTPAAPQRNPEQGAKVVSDIKPSNDGVHMRTGDVFSTDPSKTQSHHTPENPDHVENPSKEIQEESLNTNEGQKETTPAAPQRNPEQGAGEKKDEKSSNQSNNQQRNKNKNNNQGNGKNGKNKHDKNKGNNQNQNNQKTEDKKDDKSESSTVVEQKPEEKPEELTTGSDLAVTPESV